MVHHFLDWRWCPKHLSAVFKALVTVVQIKLQTLPGNISVRRLKENERACTACPSSSTGSAFKVNCPQCCKQDWIYSLDSSRFLFQHWLEESHNLPFPCFPPAQLTQGVSHFSTSNKKRNKNKESKMDENSMHVKYKVTRLVFMGWHWWIIIGCWEYHIVEGSAAENVIIDLPNTCRQWRKGEHWQISFLLADESASYLPPFTLFPKSQYKLKITLFLLASLCH